MRGRRAAIVVFAALVLLGAACDRQSATQGEIESEHLLAEGFRCRTMTVISSDGSPRSACVWIADTQELRDRGLMGVTDPSIGGRGAMVFTSDVDRSDAFWMVDTALPLTVVWVDSNGTVIGSADMDPCTTDPARCQRYSSPAPWRLAIEIPKGAAAERGLVPGAKVALGDACQ